MIIKSNASDLYTKALRTGRTDPGWVLNRDQLRYHDALQVLEGQEVNGVRLITYKEPIAMLPVGYALANKLTSRVIMLDHRFVVGNADDINPDIHVSVDRGPYVDAPIEDPAKSSPGAWWKGYPYRYDVVRLLTPWVDGFEAFTKQTPMGLQYVLDAAKSDTPWKFWECRPKTPAWAKYQPPWVDAVEAVSWHPDVDYRRKEDTPLPPNLVPWLPVP